MSQDSREAAVTHLEEIVQLVKAYEMDWDTYEDLKGKREENMAFFTTTEEAHADWAARNPEDAETLAELEATYAGFEDKAGVESALRDLSHGVQVRSAWVDQGEPLDRDGPEEFRITLSGGGPSVRIMGEFGHKGGVKRCYLQHQDWDTPWTDLITRHYECAALMTFCSLLVQD